MKALQGWKTVVFNSIMGLIALVHVINPGAELPGQEAVQGVVDNGEALFTVILAVGNVILRAVTSSPIFQKKE